MTAPNSDHDRLQACIAAASAAALAGRADLIERAVTMAWYSGKTRAFELIAAARTADPGATERATPAAVPHRAPPARSGRPTADDLEQAALARFRQQKWRTIAVDIEPARP